MTVKNYPGLVAGSHGKAGSLAGKELGKDWYLISQHKDAHLIP